MKRTHEPWPCSKCGELQEYTQPYLIDGMSGFTTPVHGCGEGFTALWCWPASKDSKHFWGKVQEHFFPKDGDL